MCDNGRDGFQMYYVVTHMMMIGAGGQNFNSDKITYCPTRIQLLSMPVLQYVVKVQFPDAIKKRLGMRI
jgi:hypothetical protein